MTLTRIATTRLGTGGPRVGVQGLGCMGMSVPTARPTPTRRGPPWSAALELGVTLFDTADIYGRGDEREVPRPVRHRRTATRSCSPPSSRIEQRPGRPDQRGIRNDPAYIRAGRRGAACGGWAST